MDISKLKSSEYNLRFDSPGPNKKARHISELEIKQNDENENELKEIPFKNQISTKVNVNTKSSKLNLSENPSNQNNNKNNINNINDDNNNYINSISNNKNLQNFNLILQENLNPKNQ